MAGSTQGSAIDDSFETLTNAPDAWVSGRYAAPPPVDYQHYVEPGDTRSAVDDRCFTEHGGAEYPRPISNTTKPSKTDQKRYRSRQPSTKPATQGKRRPSPSFRIRSRDGDSVVVNNPFVLRKPSRPQPREDSEQSSETDSQSQRSIARSRSASEARMARKLYTTSKDLCTSPRTAIHKPRRLLATIPTVKTSSIGLPISQPLATSAIRDTKRNVCSTRDELPA
jgi:hypothetical protein